MLGCCSRGQETHHVLRLGASAGSGPNSLGFWINKDCPISPLCDLSTCVALGRKTQVPGIAPSYLACEKPWVSVPGPGQGQEGARGISSLELCESLRSSLQKMRSDSLSSIPAILPFGWVALSKSLYFCKPQCLHLCVVCCCHIWLFVTPRTVVHQAPLSMGFSRQKYWSWLPLASPGDLPNPGKNPHLLHCRQIPYSLSH